jgi:hypothetical protein
VQAAQQRNSTALNAHMIATGALHGNGSSDGTISFDGSAGVSTASFDKPLGFRTAACATSQALVGATFIMRATSWHAWVDVDNSHKVTKCTALYLATRNTRSEAMACMAGRRRRRGGGSVRGAT